MTSDPHSVADTADSAIAAFCDSAAAFLGATDQRQRVRALQRVPGGFDRGYWADMADLGWFSILVPEADDGLGLGLAEVCAIARQCGHHLLPEPFVDAGVHPLQLLASLAASDTRDHLMAGLVSGGTVAGVAWQSRLGQTEVDLPQARAERRGNGLALSGTLRFVQPATGADGWIAYLSLDGVPALVWLPAAFAGTPCERLSVDGSAQCDLPLDGMELPAGAVLATGETATRALRRANEFARIAQAAELAGIARRAFEITRQYLCDRVQFGQAIGSFQALQHRLVDGWMQVELADACLEEVLVQVTAIDETGDLALLARAASRAKARCAFAATEMCRSAIQLHGAIGTTFECDIGLYFRRAMTLSARLGNAAQHRRRFVGMTRIVDTAARQAETAAATAPAYTKFPTQADWDAMPEADFRQMVRALFARHYPESRRYLPYRQTWAESKGWYMTLSRLGWLAPAWPREHGGLGLPADKLIAYIEESEAWGVARPPDQGLVMIGPILMRFGTAAQRARFLPKVLAGEHVWTQGYSEPNAGSDLASVRTEAVPDGDEFVVNGQKTWTTWGADGTHMFMLVRTDKSVKKQAGISFLLVDLKTPGITVRPIRNIADEQEFCEVFFDNVRVPKDNLVGGLNQGWTVAKALLGFERLFTGSPRHSQHTLHAVEKLARQRGLFEDAAFAARFAELQLDTLDLGAAYAGFAEIAKRGEPLPPSISMLKIWSTETYERLALLLVESAGEYGGMRDHTRTDEIDMHLVAPLFNALGAKIFAGSNEIQRNILAKAVLDLPG